jgi:hypothetical protein
MKIHRIGALVAVGALGVALMPATVAATQPDPLHKVTICHRTNSVTKPYVVIDVDEASVDGDNGNDNGQGDHLLDHLGAAFDFSADPDVTYPTPRNGDQWGDIIPPFYSDGQTLTGYPSLNWDATGMAIFYAGCGQPSETTSTTTSDETTSTTTSDETTSTTTSDETTSTTTSDETTSTTTSAETTSTTSNETTPNGSVEELTPPSTDTIGQPTSSSTVSTSLLLVLAGLLSATLVLVPAAARKRR